MLKVIPKAWSYAFSVTDGTDSVAQPVDLPWWRDIWLVMTLWKQEDSAGC
jgi:hypothetical protein